MLAKSQQPHMAILRANGTVYFWCHLLSHDLLKQIPYFFSYETY